MNGFKIFLKRLMPSLMALAVVLGIGFFLVQTAHAAPAGPALLTAGGPHQTGDPEVDQRLADALKAILLAISGLVLVPAFAPLTTLLTNILKRYLPTTIGGEYVHLAVATAIFVAFAVATKFGVGAQFQTGVGILYQILALLLPWAAVVAGGQVFYNLAQRHGWAGFGWQRRQVGEGFATAAGERRG